jgi:pimeloyl-ACP methyl ester carboxylesterase
MTLSMGLFLIGILGLSCLSTSIFKQQNQALAQQYITTIKYRNLVIDLGNGVKTNAQLTLPALGKGPFPGVLLVAGSGAIDKNATAGFILKNRPIPPTPFWQIAQYLSERGFAVLRYDKRGVGGNFTILNSDVWGNVTISDLIQDAKKALNVLVQQPEVDPKRISIIGHSQGTVIAPRVAIDNSNKVKNIVLMATQAQSLGDLGYYQAVGLPFLYIEKVLHPDHDGLLSINKASKSPIFSRLIDGNITSYFLTQNITTNNGTKQIQLKPVYIANKVGGADAYININTELKPFLEELLINATSIPTTKYKCFNLNDCPISRNSDLILEPNLSIIGNVSNATGILILQGDNDTQTPIQEAFLLEQKLTQLHRYDHTLLTYPNLGHLFYPSSQWLTGIGPIEQYVLADLYAWLEAHSGLSHSFATPTSTIGANTSSLNTSTTSASSSSKR